MAKLPAAEKAPQPAASAVRPDVEAGPHGSALAPPAYGIDLADQYATPADAVPVQRLVLADRAGDAAPGTSPPNRTGLPDAVKSGIEALSGLALDDVRVHFNSPHPARLQARAYTQGSEIHVAPGQARHLPHEAWHVVQQKQGRVRATARLRSGLAINDDAGLEREAAVMGRRALGQPGRVGGAPLAPGSTVPGHPTVVQRLKIVLQSIGDNPTITIRTLKDVGEESHFATWLQQARDNKTVLEGVLRQLEGGLEEVFRKIAALNDQESSNAEQIDTLLEEQRAIRSAIIMISSLDIMIQPESSSGEPSLRDVNNSNLAPMSSPTMNRPTIEDFDQTLGRIKEGHIVKQKMDMSNIATLEHDNRDEFHGLCDNMIELWKKNPDNPPIRQALRASISAQSEFGLNEAYKWIDSLCNMTGAMGDLVYAATLVILQRQVDIIVLDNANLRAIHQPQGQGYMDELSNAIWIARLGPPDVPRTLLHEFTHLLLVSRYRNKSVPAPAPGTPAWMDATLSQWKLRSKEPVWPNPTWKLTHSEDKLKENITNVLKQLVGPDKREDNKEDSTNFFEAVVGSKKGKGYEEAMQPAEIGSHVIEILHILYQSGADDQQAALYLKDLLPKAHFNLYNILVSTIRFRW